MKRKGKFEDIFILILLFSFFSLTLFSTGCGGSKECEKLECGENSDFYAVSIPGIGGCLSSGNGCRAGGCMAWSQSCKFVKGSTVIGDDKSKDTQNQISIVLLDNQYYEDNGCGSCAVPYAKSCYITSISTGNDDSIVMCSHPSCTWGIGPRGFIHTDGKIPGFDSMIYYIEEMAFSD